MPTYEYQCDGCEHRFELFQKLSDPPVSTCPQCKARRVRKLISRGAGVIFKGSGFYSTENKRGSAPAEPKKTTRRSVKKDKDSEGKKKEE